MKASALVEPGEKALVVRLREYGFRIQFGERDFQGETTSTWFHFAGVREELPVRVIPPPDAA